jgi:hypothetical protein
MGQQRHRQRRAWLAEGVRAMGGEGEGFAIMPADAFVFGSLGLPPCFYAKNLKKFIFLYCLPKPNPNGSVFTLWFFGVKSPRQRFIPLSGIFCFGTAIRPPIAGNE